jgi:hypothetical protein
MNDALLFSKDGLAAINHRQQLKVIMNLPVRLISDDKIMDVLPLRLDPNGTYVPKLKRKYLVANPFVGNTPDQLIAFFHDCQLGDLLLPVQVAEHYNVSHSTIKRWSREGILKRVRITFDYTVYKRCELPSMEIIYNIQG